VTGPVAFIEISFEVGSISYCARIEAFDRNEEGKIAARGTTLPCVAPPTATATEIPPTGNRNSHSYEYAIAYGGSDLDEDSDSNANLNRDAVAHRDRDAYENHDAYCYLHADGNTAVDGRIVTMCS